MINCAIIPARGGSKRIPHKNIKTFLGKPIIAYAIETAIKSGMFNRVFVSTDNTEIAEISKKYGASIPFLRSEKNSNDFATTDDVLNEVISNLLKNNYNFDSLCCIYPTSPLLSIKNLISAYHLMINKDYDSVFAITEFSYPIYRGLKIKNGKVEMIWPENKQHRSQDLPLVYHDAGQFYWSKKDAFLKYGSLWTDNTGALKLSNIEVQDIDNETDWLIAELKYQLLNEI
jgi:N-acylneuraminate cytidylyltransferase